MDKLLVVCGPTATGKTDLALLLATKFSGELICADSRQVYIGTDIITGKDIPKNYYKLESEISWNNRNLTYFTDGNIRIWLADVVNPNESFNVSFFNECAQLVIADIHHRSKLPIVVGVTGLYIKSLITDLRDIHKPYNSELRNSLANKSPEELFSRLIEIDQIKAEKLNFSDRRNPRRLTRAIEVSLDNIATPSFPTYDSFQIGLSGDRQKAFERIDSRVLKRISMGAEKEVQNLLKSGYAWDLPIMQTSGYFVWKNYFENNISISQVIEKWQTAEHTEYRNQERWFKKQSAVHWLNVDNPEYPNEALTQVESWYNKTDA